MPETQGQAGVRHGELGLTEGELGHHTVAALTDAEHQRWVGRCRTLEDGEHHVWPEAESRALVAAVLGCLYGEDVSQLAGPARAWAHANPTPGIVVRRLGCLRELFAQEGVMGSGDAAARLAEILDKVTIHSTESALGRWDGAAAPGAEDVAGRAAPRPLFTRRRMAAGALGLGALAAVVALTLLALPSSGHRPPPQASHSSSPGRGPGSSAPSRPSGSAGPAGTAGTAVSSRPPSVGGPASGSTVVRTVDFGTPVGGAAPAGAGSSSGSPAPSGAGTPSTEGSGGSVTLPGGLSVPVPSGPSVPSLPLPGVPSVPALPVPGVPSVPSMALPFLPA